jgi:hypothetical protein
MSISVQVQVAVCPRLATKKREQAARDYQDAIERAENHEGLAPIFAENRAAVLRGEHVEDNPRSLVLEILAAQLGLSGPAAAQYNPPDGTPIVMTNGEPGIYHAPKRPDRNDRRRRRNGHRFTPEPVKGWKPSPFGTWRVVTSDEITPAEETDTD